MNFKTQYGEKKHYFSNPGEKIVKTYSPKIFKDGHKDVVVTGEKNLHALIQVDKDSVDINLIIKRYSAGDVEAINKVKGVYMDCSDMPQTYAEQLQRSIDLGIIFDRLPIDIKQQFDNNPDVFWVSAFNKDKKFLDVFGLDKPFERMDSFDDVKETVEETVEGGVE